MVAYVLARVLKEVTKGGLEAVDIDTRLANLGKNASALKDAAGNALDSTSRAIGGTDDDEIDLSGGDEYSFDGNSGSSSLVSTVDDGSPKLSQTIPEAVYWLIFALFLPAALDALGIEAVSAPAKQIIARVSSLLPNFLGAGVVIGVAVFIGKFVSKLATELLSGVGFDNVPQQLGLNLSSANPCLLYTSPSPRD